MTQEDSKAADMVAIARATSNTWPQAYGKLELVEGFHTQRSVR